MELRSNDFKRNNIQKNITSSNFRNTSIPEQQEEHVHDQQ
jgi:hypothetical protein